MTYVAPFSLLVKNIHWMFFTRALHCASLHLKSVNRLVGDSRKCVSQSRSYAITLLIDLPLIELR